MKEKHDDPTLAAAGVALPHAPTGAGPETGAGVQARFEENKLELLLKVDGAIKVLQAHRLLIGATHTNDTDRLRYEMDSLMRTFADYGFDLAALSSDIGR